MDDLILNQPEDEQPNEQAEGMNSSKCTLADDLVASAARYLIANYHTRLVEARFVYLFRHGDWETGSGRTIPGEVYKVNDRAKVAGYPYDFEVVLNWGHWQNVDSETRAAILDHQLRHCDRAIDANGDYASNDDGTPKWRKVPHDFADFFDVVRRNGTGWHEDLVKLEEIILQPELPGVSRPAAG